MDLDHSPHCAFLSCIRPPKKEAHRHSLCSVHYRTYKDAPGIFNQRMLEQVWYENHRPTGRGHLTKYLNRHKGK